MRGHYVGRTWQRDPTLYAPPRYRRACSYEAFVPDELVGLEVELPGHVAGAVSEAEKAVADLNASASSELAPLARLLLRTESIASSKVEGLQVGARELARAEANEASGRSIGTEAREIIANIDAMQFAIEDASSHPELTIDAIVEIHRVLMAGAPNSNLTGRIRERQNWIGGNDYNPCGAAFVPPPSEEVMRLLGDLVRFADDDALPPIVHAAFAHAQFETIHPFEDGNGRTGRALIQILLLRRGSASTFVPPISVVFAQRKDGYIGGLTSYREDRLADWIETFAGAAARAATLASRYLDRVRALQNDWRRRLHANGRPRADAAAWSLIDVLPAHPVLTVPVGVAASRRTKPAVTNAVDQLVRCGVLLPLGASTRNRAWEARGLIDLIEGLEAGKD